MSSGESRNQGSNLVSERGVPLSEQMHTLRNIIKHQALVHLIYGVAQI